MYRGIDLNRDQSYFLFNTTKDQLNFLRFPLGNLLKDETRNIARELDLNVADKPDSQDICFVPNGDYASNVELVVGEQNEVLEAIRRGAGVVPQAMQRVVHPRCGEQSQGLSALRQNIVVAVGNGVVHAHQVGQVEHVG